MMPVAAGHDYARRAGAKRRSVQPSVLAAGGLALASIQPVIA